MNLRENTIGKNLRKASYQLIFLCALLPARVFSEQGSGGFQGGGQSGGQGGGGGSALEGVAAIVAAGAPIATAAIQASQSKAEAQAASEMAIYGAQTAYEVSSYQTKNLKETTLYQTFVAAQVAESNNKYASERLQKQLDQVQDSFNKSLALNRDSFRTEMDYKYQQLALSDKLETQKLELERVKAKTSMVQAGISSGFTDVGSTVATGTSLNGTQETARAIAVAKDPALRLLSQSSKVGKEGALKSGFLSRNLASGSTRGKRNVVSDLSAFKSTLSGQRTLASQDNGLVAHAVRDNSAISVPFRVHGQGNR